MTRMSVSRGSAALAAVLMVCGLFLAQRPAWSDTSPQTAVADDAGTAAKFHQKVNETLRLRASTLATLEVDPTLGEAKLINLPVDGIWQTASLEPHSVRASSYRLLVDDGTGVLKEIEPGPVSTFRGELLESPGSLVAASIEPDGLRARILLSDGSEYWVEPLSRFQEAAPGEHVIYRSDDLIGSPGECGTLHDEAAMVDEFAEPTPIGVRGTPSVMVAELACDADFPYFQDHGSSVGATETRINNVINAVNVQYERDVLITHQITAIVVRTSSGTYTSNSSNTLLNQFRNEWLTNQGGIQRDVAKLFTGRELIGSVIGEAFTIGGICTTSAYCHSQSDCCGSFGCTTDLAAHELGHLWNGIHCDCSSPPFTMNTPLICANQFSALNISRIESHRNSRTCLSDTVPRPENNDCANATPVTEGTYAFDNTDATTDGPNEPFTCSFDGDTDVQSDIWYRYTASCDGMATASLCGSNYDTKLAAYGAVCPTSSGTTVACNDDFDCDGDGGTTDDGSVSEVTFAVTAGNDYLLRIGGFNGAEGTGTLEIFCTPTIPACDNDTIATATTIGSLPFSVAGDTSGCADDLDPECGGTTSGAPDAVFEYTTSSVNQLVDIDLCGSSFDTRLLVFESDGTTLLACASDGCPDGNAALNDLALKAGSTYYIVVDGDTASGGQYSLLMVDDSPLIFHELIELPITADAIADDPALASAQTFDFVATFQNDWTTTSQVATAEVDGLFYDDPNGNNVPQTPLFPFDPSLEFDSFWSAPGLVAPSFAGPIVTDPSMRATDWFDTTVSPPGTYTLARFTVLEGTTLHVTGNSTVTVNNEGQSFPFDLTVTLNIPEPGCPNDPTGQACDTDVTGDCLVNNQDLGTLLASYLLTTGDSGYNAAVDFDDSGDVNNVDLGEMLADYLNDCN